MVLISERICSPAFSPDGSEFHSLGRPVTPVPKPYFQLRLSQIFIRSMTSILLMASSYWMNILSVFLTNSAWCPKAKFHISPLLFGNSDLLTINHSCKNILTKPIMILQQFYHIETLAIERSETLFPSSCPTCSFFFTLVTYPLSPPPPPSILR